MVFCNLLSSDGDKLIYAIGGSPEDVTGELAVNLRDGSFDLVKAPEKTKVYARHIGAMLRKAQAKFEKGTYPERLAYEI